MRERYSILASVSIVVKMIYYYSVNKPLFETLPKYNKHIEGLAKTIRLIVNKRKYTFNTRGSVKDGEGNIISSLKHNCSCKYFLKDAICAHVLAYMFECHPNDLWFGSKWRAEQSFAYNTKRGKKAKGRVPMSEPALSAYKQK